MSDPDLTPVFIENADNYHWKLQNPHLLWFIIGL